MKISYNWLKEYINIDINPDELSGILTDIGLEVEGVETFEEVKGGLKGMVIGHVLTCEKHPNADKLSKTTVNVGADTVLNIVCGAPNVAAGQKVVVATIGSELFHSEGSFVIKKTKIRGEVSEGMICAEDELGLGTSHDGIMVLSEDAVIGSEASDYFQIKTDTVFEIGLTPNRVDAASHFGVARDLAAYFSLNNPKELNKPSVDDFKVDNTSNEVIVESVDNQACKRYAGLTMSGLKVAPSPKWLQLRLQAIGLIPINNIVDATNYVLHELAQPLHAFDADKLAGKKIIVKKLPEGTSFVTLDEVERKLAADDLMICDAEKPACIGGVFGGIHSGVTEETTSIFLESAYFDPVHIRKTAKKHGLSTDASFRFERGIDPDITIQALKRAAMLIKEIAGGEITSDITDIYPEPIPFHEVKVKYAHINRLIGKNIDRDTIEKIVTSLEMVYVSDNCEEMHLRIPPYRVDVTREADVIEDLLRLYGYNNIEFSSRMVSSISPSQKPDNEKLVNKMSDFLASAGFNEIMSNSLQKSDYYTDLSIYKQENCVEILNPLSNDLNVMRQTLIFSGLEAVALNVNFQNANLRLFEYGRCYKLTGKSGEGLKPYGEDMRFAIFSTGNRDTNSWAVQERKSDFYELKAYTEAFLTKLGVDIEQFDVESLEENDLFSGGVSLVSNGKTIVETGVVSEAILGKFDIKQEVFASEIYWSELIKLVDKPTRFKELPKQFKIRRDLALLINENVKFEEIKKIAFQTEKQLLTEVSLFDYYKGKGVPDGKKSYGVCFYLIDEQKTLTDKVIDKTMNKLIQRYQKEFNAELR